MITVLNLLKWLSYLCLAAAIVGLLSLFLPFQLDLCREAGGGQVTCDAPIYRDIFELGFTVTMMGFYLALPAALAGLGVIFLLIDIVRRWRGE